VLLYRMAGTAAMAGTAGDKVAVVAVAAVLEVQL